MKKNISSALIACLVMMLFVSCGRGGLKGTYVARNDAAKQSMYTKFIFKGGKVKIIMGTGGIEMPGGYEYDFSREGDKVKIELKVAGMSMGSVDLNYNEKTDELRLFFGGELGSAVNERAPVWAKEGSFDPKAPYPKKEEKKSTVNIPVEEKPADDTDKKGGIIDRVKGIVDWVKGLFGKNPSPESGITLSKTSLTLNTDSDTSRVLTVTVFPPEISEKNKKIIWKSSNSAVATVDLKGRVTAVGTGKAVISAYMGDYSATCYVTVKSGQQAPPEESLTPIPTVKQPLTDSEILSIFSQISNGDKEAFDRFIKEVGTNINVEGAENINNSYELAVDAYQGSNYSISIQRNNNGKIYKIIVK